MGITAFTEHTFQCHKHTHHPGNCYQHTEYAEYAENSYKPVQNYIMHNKLYFHNKTTESSDTNYNSKAMILCENISLKNPQILKLIF